MLSYLHSYHAGNFADVHKHVSLLLLLEKMTEKSKPLCYQDTHAGRGHYDLAAPEAQKTGEHLVGFSAINVSSSNVSGFGRYINFIETYRRKYGATAYPGSPAIAQALLRANDRMVMSELHPAEMPKLKRFFVNDRRAEIHQRDALEAMVGVNPPRERRGLIFVDPSYEVKTEYATVPQAVARTLKRFQSGVFAVWYPILDQRHVPLVDKLKGLGAACFISELYADAPIEGHRMIGSGVAVLNPPWQYDALMRDACADIANALFKGRGRFNNTLY